MLSRPFPVIDPVATGQNILRLRTQRGMTVRDLQTYFGFEQPQAIYKWQSGRSLPSVDNLCALSALLEVSMEEILVCRDRDLNIIENEQQAKACCSLHIYRWRFVPHVFPLRHDAEAPLTSAAPAWRGSPLRFVGTRRQNYRNTRGLRCPRPVLQTASAGKSCLRDHRE